MENNEQPKNPCEYPKNNYECPDYLVVEYSKMVRINKYLGLKFFYDINVT